MNFVFHHVGADPNAELFVNSIRATNPNARIIQRSDPLTLEINGVSKVFRINSDASNLMTFRLECFSDLGLRESAVYLDTDTLVLGRLIPETFLKDSQVVCCN